MGRIKEKLYNNAIIQTSYKPYVPLPKKKTVNSDENNEQQTQKGYKTEQVDYNGSNNRQGTSGDAFVRQNAVPKTNININQLLIDFTSTLNAIGPSEEIEQEVRSYIDLVKTQANKAIPNKKIMVSNLKIAADILDTYISDTLQKPSKVVKNWVDALLLQSIDFKADNNIKIGAFESITGEAPQTAKLAEEKLAKKEQMRLAGEPDIHTEENTDVLQPEETLVEVEVQNVQNVDNIVDTEKNVNNELEVLVESAADKEPKEALSILSQAFSIAQENSDKSSMAHIYSKIADVQNSVNNLPKALDCLNASNILAYSLNDNELKTYNHKQMGRIYDETGFTETAISHYFASIAVDGVLDDTTNQADTLNSVGLIYTANYDKDIAIDTYKDALALAKVNKDTDIMSRIFSNSAKTFANANLTSKAMDNYKNAALLSKQSGDNKALAEIYENAADLMSEKKYQKRALDLYKKSYRIAQNNNVNTDILRLREKIAALNV